MRVTLQDIAERTGADVATVSRVLRGLARQYQISRDREQRILAVARQVGYVRNGAAASLASGRFRQIGVLGPGGSTLFSPYQEGVLRGLWMAACEEGYRLVVDAPAPNRPISFLVERFVDGLVVLAPSRHLMTPEVQRGLREMGMPVVVVGRGHSMPAFHSVDIRNQAVGRQAARCLLDFGHRAFAILGGDAEDDTTQRRREGFLAEVKRQGLDPRGVLLKANGYTGDEAHVDARCLLSHRAVTGIFCINDAVALAVYRAARELGLAIPRDLSVIGVDAIEAGQHTIPPLTTFRQPLEAIGREAFRLLMARGGRPIHRFFDVEWVEGGSVGPPVLKPKRDLRRAIAFRAN